MPRKLYPLKMESWKGLEILVITIEDFLEEIIEDNSYRNCRERYIH
jgi:hypothetical protein